MDLNKIKKIDDVIQKWLTDNRMMNATSEMVFPKLVEEGLYGDSKEDYDMFIKEIRQLSSKEKHKFLNVRTTGVLIGFRSRY